MSVLPRISLRGRFLLYALFGIVLPLALVGFWLARSSERSGVELVRARLAASLGDGVEEFGTQWARNVSLLIDLAETDALVTALRGEPGWPGNGDVPSTELVARWRAVSGFVWFVEVRDERGWSVARLPDDLGESRSISSPPPGFLNYDVPVRERFSGDRLGTLAVQFRGDGLLPVGALTPGVSGTVVAIVDRRTGAALAPLPLDPELFSQERFLWGDEEWITVVRDLADPPVRFALAAPLAPVTAPLADAARRGTVALIITIVVVFGLATLFTRRLTRSLEGLSSAAGAVARGDLDARVDVTGPPSVRETAHAFNVMSAALRETLDRLSQQEALAAVGEFAASLAHEVRNPLTSIRMDLERAEKKFDSAPTEATALLARALGAIDRLNTSVTDFLRVARSGRVRRESIDLRTSIEAAIRAATPRIAAKDGRLGYAPPERPVWVRGDEGALEELVLNLLLNAADALDTGGRAAISLEDDGAGVTVSVRDEGQGLTEDLREKIFEPFYTTKDGGTGLGLAIARRIARAHGSDLKVESPPGAGTTFCFHLAKVSPPANRIVTQPPDGGHESGRRL
jgi:signal transduction histidine kinase